MQDIDSTDLDSDCIAALRDMAARNAVPSKMLVQLEDMLEWDSPRPVHSAAYFIEAFGLPLEEVKVLFSAWRKFNDQGSMGDPEFDQAMGALIGRSWRR